MAVVGKSHRPKREKIEADKPVIARTAYDLQRLKLEKLMKNTVCNSGALFVLLNLNRSLLPVPYSSRIVYQRYRSLSQVL
jgi:hypothetical protein